MGTGSKLRALAGWSCLVLILGGCDQKRRPGDADAESDAEDEGADVPYVVPILVEGGTGVDIVEETEYHVPDNDTSQTTAIYTTEAELITIHNISDGAVVINRILVDVGDRIAEEEFTLRESGAVGSAPFVADDVIVSAGSSIGFYVHFFPIAGSTRDATITIGYESTHSYIFTLLGTGEPEDLSRFSDGGPALHKVVGQASTDESIAGMAMDSSGNSYIAGYAAGIVDTEAEDVLLLRLDPEGAMDWGKIWHSSFTDGHRDWIGPTAAGREGGASGSVAHDAEHVYVAGSTNATASNPESANLALLMKVDATTGDMAWDRVWTPVDPPTGPTHAAKAHSVDVAGDHVYVTGTTGAADSDEHSHVFLLALDRAAGDTILFQQAFDLADALDDRGYAVRMDASGGAFIGGSTSTAGFVLKVQNADTASPTVAWAKQIDLGSSGSVNALDVDSRGDVIASCDRGGDGFSILKLSGDDGNLAWGTSYVHGSSSTMNKAHVVRATADSVFAGGIIGLDGYGTGLGDAMLLHLLPSTGDLEWASFYYTGSEPDQDCTHRLKAVSLHEDSLYLAGQVVTGSSNSSRYLGYWYDAPATTESWSPTLTDITPDAFPMTGGAVRDAAPDRTWEDLPDIVLVQNGWDKTDGEAEDEDILWMTIFI
jgi:hypothetical protein